jgi:hypothetical protein
MSGYNGYCIPANRRVYLKRVKRETYNNLHSDLKLASEFFYAQLITCIAFPDMHAEVSTRVKGFKFGRG